MKMISQICTKCYQDEASYDTHANSKQFKDFTDVAKDILTSRVKVELFPEFISTKAVEMIIQKLTTATQATYSTKVCATNC